DETDLCLLEGSVVSRYIVHLKEAKLHSWRTLSVDVYPTSTQCSMVVNNIQDCTIVKVHHRKGTEKQSTTFICTVSADLVLSM
ncbi:hypothetical protein GBAR_LOCUS3858, partial [Geodia barretti]